MLKSVHLLEHTGQIDKCSVPEFHGRTLFEELCWRMRLAFFRDGRNIAYQRTQLELADSLGIAKDAILAKIENGEAHAALCRDSELQKEYFVQGSPTFLLNEGRQKLYGNIGYRVIEANVMELLEHPTDRASWC
jgi:predicted DsbA family dithiol-disulfide isomerase